MLSNHLILFHPLLLPSIFPSIRVFYNELALHIRWPKYWHFSMSPSNEYSGLIFFRIDWFVLLMVQRILKSLLQDHSLKVSILQHSAIFMVHFLHPYMTTRKTRALTRWIVVGKVTSPFLLSVQVCHSFPYKKQVSFNFIATVTSAVILEPKKLTSITVGIFLTHLFTMK